MWNTLNIYLILSIEETGDGCRTTLIIKMLITHVTTSLGDLKA